MTHFFLDRLDSPLGAILLVHDAEGQLRALDFATHEDRMHRLLRLHYGKVALTDAPAPAALRGALEAYFAGDRAALDALPVATGGTAFQRKVWAALRRIPAGATRSYKDIAVELGQPSATRAIGMANGANPIGIVVPCHRVIAHDGTLGGYGGGLDRKRWLLAHEGVALRA